MMLALGSIVTGVVLAPTASADSPAIAVSTGGDESILAGEKATFSISAKNSFDGMYNLAFTALVPLGIAFDGATAGLGAPTVRTGDPYAPAGFQLWVWEDVSDLPTRATFTAEITVKPAQPARGTEVNGDLALFPVGSDLAITATAYASTDARVLPVFPGSTGKGNGASTVGGNKPTATTAVEALRVTKSEPSPEQELLRGAHDQNTTYSIVVKNTSEGETRDVVVVDYLPAGLEFIGNGATNSLSPVEEYPTSGPISHGSPTNYRAPATVETIVAGSGDPGYLAAGKVYTKVTWVIPAMAADAELAIEYLAAVPLRENVMWPEGATPATAGEQTAHLGNNTGPSTREGTTDPHSPSDGMSLTNWAGASGQYQGVVRSQADRATSDHDSVTVTAEDLAIVKSSDTTTFTTGQVARFTLKLRTSEYVTADALVVTDTIDNGLRPVLPMGTTVAEGPVPADWFSEDANVEGGAIESVSYDAATGITVLVFSSALSPIPASTDGHDIVYSVVMRDNYDDSTGHGHGPTTSGDSFGNHVTVSGRTASIAPLDAEGWFPGTNFVLDESSTSISSEFTSISKSVLPRDLVVAGADPGATPGFVDGTETIPGGFRQGDTVVYELRVEFPKTIDARNPALTDLLPAGITFGGWANASGDEFTDEVELVPGDIFSLKLGTALPGNPDRYVAQKSVLTIHIWGTIDSLSEAAASLDKPQNLMKYQQTNVEGEVFFLRDAAAIQVESGVTLLKGVESVNGATDRAAESQNDAVGTVFNSNRDGISVLEGESVRYRVDLSARPFPVTGLQVWDALPAGVKKANVSDLTDGATVYDPADSGYPTDLASSVSGRSVIVWTGLSLAANAQKTLGYTVTVPEGVGATARLGNTASIIRYDVAINRGESPIEYRPEDSLSTTLGTVPGEGTRDGSVVKLPDATLVKQLDRTEFDSATNNGATQVVEGETATYTYTLTVPAHTSVLNGVLSDNGVSSGTFAVVAADSSFTVPTGVDESLFTFTPTTGKLAFPGTYANSTSADQVFSVTLTVYTTKAFTNGSTLSNTATFASGTTTKTASANSTFIAADPKVAKSADKDVVEADGTVTYTLTASNPTGRPTSFQTVVTDVVPSGLAVLLPLPAGASSAPGANGTTVITWTIGELLAGVNQTLTYSVEVEETAAGGAVYKNTASLIGSTLPATHDSTHAGSLAPTPVTKEVRVPDASISKTATPTTAGATSIGDTVAYEVTVTLPSNVNFYDVRFTDVMPSGLALVGTAAIASSDPSIPSFVADHSGSTLSWIVPGSGDVPSSTASRTVTISYTAVISDLAAIKAASSLKNVASVVWNTVDNDSSTTTKAETNATVVVREPALTIVKKVDGKDSISASQQQVFDYGITVSNPVTATSSTAYDAVITDVVPEGVIVDVDTISTEGVATVVDGVVTKIVWTIDELAPGATAELGYSAVLAATETLDDSALVNTVSVTEYFSTAEPTDGRRKYTGPQDTASVTPAFPFVSVLKDVTSGTNARVGSAFGWTLTATNSGGATAKTVTLVDTLPYGWGFDSGSASVTVAGVKTPLDDPKTGSAGGKSTLTWTLQDLAASGVAVVTFTTTPTSAAYTAPGAGYGSVDASPAHVNTVSVAATDVTGASSNKDEDFSGDPDDAEAFLTVTDISVTKTLVSTSPADVGSDATYLVTVTNNGPQDATSVTALDALPAGLTFTGVTTKVTNATAGWSFVFSGDTVTGSLPALANGQSASFRVTARLTAAASPTVTNSVTVATATPETNYENNTSSVPVTATPIADLAIDKQFVAGDVVAGETISWTIDVTNLGPSTAAGPIVVVDTLPAGVSNVAPVELDESWVFGGVSEGKVTFTRAEGLALGASAPKITLSMTVDSSVIPGTVLSNTATVSGATKELVTTNNSDTAVTEGSEAVADLTLEKSIAEDGALTAGETGRYRILVSNIGSSDAIEVSVEDALPEGLSYVGAITTDDDHTWAYQGVDEDGVSTFSLTSGSLAAGESTWFEFDVDVDAALTGDVTNVATVLTDTEESDDTNNSGEITSPVTVLTNVVIAKTANAESGRIGDLVSFTVTVTNEGSATATNVVVADALPAGLTFEGVDTPGEGEGWSFSDDGTTLTATLDDPLGVTAPANVVSFTVTARVVPAAYPSVTNSASVSTDTPESSTEDNSDSAEVTVPAQVDLAIVKTLGEDGLVVGQTAEYTLTVTNNGPTENPGVIRVADVLPESLRLVSVDTEDCEMVDPADGDGGTLDCEIAGPLAVDGTFAIVLTVEVLPGAYPEVSNTATVETDSEDLDPENDGSTIVSPVTPDIRFALAKKLESVDGATLVWKVTVASIGLNDAVDGVTIVDELPSELTFVDASSEEGFDCEQDSGVITCEHPDVLPTGESASFIVTTTTSQAAGAKVTNSAYIIDPATDELLPGSEVSADYTSPMPVTGAALPIGLIGFGVLALLLGGGLILLRGGRRSDHRA